MHSRPVSRTPISMIVRPSSSRRRQAGDNSWLCALFQHLCCPPQSKNHVHDLRWNCVVSKRSPGERSNTRILDKFDAGIAVTVLDCTLIFKNALGLTRAVL